MRETHDSELWVMYKIHKPHNHIRESYINQLITTNRWRPTATSCGILWVNWLYSVKPKTYLWLITISHVKSALLSQIRDSNCDENAFCSPKTQRSQQCGDWPSPAQRIVDWHENSWRLFVTLFAPDKCSYSHREERASHPFIARGIRGNKLLVESSEQTTVQGQRGCPLRRSRVWYEKNT